MEEEKSFEGESSIYLSKQNKSLIIIIIILIIIIIIIIIIIKTLFTTQSEYLQIYEYNAKTNHALCTKMSIKELAYNG